MERRYELLSKMNTRNISQYNKKIETIEKPDDDTELQKLPYLVIVIDELADLMMLASRDVEITLTRLAQMARAAGIHLILATQRPSVDVLTGIIKANFPTRLTFQVSSKTDSRTIIDTNGAENLLGSGDMLFLPPGTAKLQRIHGAYISESELVQITKFLRAQAKPDYDDEVTEAAVVDAAADEEQEYDERYDDAIALVTKTGQASISMIQRHLRVGYNRAARMIEVMEKEGVVGPSDGVKPREVLVASYERRK
jgi:S-DNA-T family DNA segregation ATPase FtsK/SpoIIIE